MTTRVEIEKFCLANDVYTEREYLRKPFSIGEWSYATNGHIAVRVPRRSDVPQLIDTAASESVERVFLQVHEPSYTPLPAIEIPEPDEKIIGCDECGGSGKEHDCPNCSHVCRLCNGTGKDSCTPVVTVGIGRKNFKAGHIEMLQALPDVEVDRKGQMPKPMAFRFAGGGEGLLMPFTGYSDLHIIA
jgi:hypothetical protein